MAGFKRARNVTASAVAAGAWVARVLGALLVAGGLLALGAETALAHARYVNSTPGNGSVVASAPARIVARFSEAVRPAGSSMTVLAPDGSRADNGDSSVDTTDPSRTTMTVSLKPGLANGTYLVNFTTVSADDGETETNRFTFSIGAPSINVALPRTGGGGGAPGVLVLAGGGLALAGVALRRSTRHATDD